MIRILLAQEERCEPCKHTLAVREGPALCRPRAPRLPCEPRVPSTASLGGGSQRAWASIGAIEPAPRHFLCSAFRRWDGSLWGSARWARGAALTSSTAWRSGCYRPCRSRCSVSRKRCASTPTPTVIRVRLPFSLCKLLSDCGGKAHVGWVPFCLLKLELNFAPRTHCCRQGGETWDDTAWAVYTAQIRAVHTLAVLPLVDRSPCARFHSICL